MRVEPLPIEARSKPKLDKALVEPYPIEAITMPAMCRISYFLGPAENQENKKFSP